MKLSEKIEGFFKDRLGVENINLYTYNYNGRPRMYVFMSDQLNFIFTTYKNRGRQDYHLAKLQNQSLVSDDNIKMIIDKWIRSEYL